MLKLKNLLIHKLPFLALFICGFIYSQQIDYVDFKECNLNLHINPFKEMVQGDLTYKIQVLKNTDSIYLDARNIDFEQIKVNRAIPKTSYDKKRLVVYKKFKKGKKYLVTIKYQAKPKKAMYFIGWGQQDAKKQVWTQGQGKNNSNWIPSIEDVREKVVYHLNISFHKDYEVIANGVLEDVKQHEDSLKTWKFTMKNPMSSYLLAIAAGKYRKKTIYSTSNIPIELYYYPEDAAKVEPTYRYTKEIFDFLEHKTGYPYPWQVYKQVPVKDFLYAGMENTTTTIFTDSYVVDSIAFTDKDYVNINAHEMAHQWFGNLVTAASGEHHWLQEGFATYFAYCAQRKIFGDDFYYQKLYETAQQLIAYSKEGKGQSLLDPKASSLTFYEKGAWVLHMLETKIGEKQFNKSVQTFLNTYKFKSATTNDFLNIVEKVAGIDLTHFKEAWFINKNIPEVSARLNVKGLEIALNSADIKLPALVFNKKLEPIDTFTLNQNSNFADLIKNPDSIRNIVPNYNYQVLAAVNFEKPADMMIDQLLNHKNVALKIEAFQELDITKELLYKILKGKQPQILKEMALYQLTRILDSTDNAYVKSVLNGNNLKLKQVISSSLPKIPGELKQEFETLLHNKSYKTIENALLKLWINFPEERKTYLNKTREAEGFNDKNIKMLWLALALLTQEYQSSLTPVHYKELSNYTDRYYSYEIRKNAFNYLFQLQLLSDKNLKDLILAGNHPVWQFASYAKQLLKRLLKDKDYHFRIKNIAEGLQEKEASWILKQLKNTK